MPNLAELTDYDPQSVIPEADGIRRVYITGNSSSLPVDNTVFNGVPEAVVEAPVSQPSRASSLVNSVINKLFRDDDQRYQLWPEKVVREALTGANKVMEEGSNLGLRREDVTDIPAPNMPTKDSTWLGEKLGIAPVYATPQDSIIEKAQAISALAGTGGLAGSGKEAGMSLGVVPVDIAKKLKFETGKPSDILKQAVDNTPAASIDADGHLIINMVRHQMTDQAGADSVRGGVFYLPEGSPNAKHYNGSTNNYYGGQEKIEGQTAYKNPLVVKGATGGKAPEMAYNELMGNKKAYDALNKDVMDVVIASGWMKKKDPAAFHDLLNQFLDKHAPEMRGYGDYILDNSKHGNQLRYALSEAAIASAARNAGYDGIIGYSVGRGKNKGKPFLSEVFDTRESHYPSPNGDYRVHSELYSDSSKPGGAIQANRASLRPALKYKDRLYKGKPGQQHMDVIPDALYPEFQKMAMSGEDISHYNFGFVNDKGHFLSREDALKYGIDNGLIDPQAGKYGALTSTLMADSSKPGTAIEAIDIPQSLRDTAMHKGFPLFSSTHMFVPVDYEPEFKK